MILSEEEVEQIKQGKHKTYLWKPKSIIWHLPKKE